MTAFELRAVVNLGGPLAWHELVPLLDAGLDSVWLRAHTSDGVLRLEAERWSEALRTREVRCIRSLAVWRDDCGDGLHLRRSELLPADARVASMAVHNPAELAEAERCSAASVLVSPVFAPLSKGASGTSLGLAGLSALAAVSTRPCIALGGITAQRLTDCAAAGAQGAAVLGALLSDEGRSALRGWLEQRAVRLPSA